MGRTSIIYRDPRVTLPPATPFLDSVISHHTYHFSLFKRNHSENYLTSLSPYKFTIRVAIQCSLWLTKYFPTRSGRKIFNIRTEYENPLLRVHELTEISKWGEKVQIVFE